MSVSDYNPLFWYEIIRSSMWVPKFSINLPPAPSEFHALCSHKTHLHNNKLRMGGATALAVTH